MSMSKAFAEALRLGNFVKQSDGSLTRRPSGPMGPTKVPTNWNPVPGPKSTQHVRQDKPPNKWEQEYAAILRAKYPDCRVREQSFKVRVANGAFYKCDLTVSKPLRGGFICVEVKGKRGMKGHAKGILAIKTAAAQWPEFDFVLVWKQEGVWCEQWIKP